MENILYKSKKDDNNLPYYLIQSVFLSIAAYLLIHVEDNPVFIFIVSFVILFVVCANSRDVIVVRETYFELGFIRMVPVFSTSKTFFYSDIESMEADLPLTKSNSFFYELRSLMVSVAAAPSNNIGISFKNGKKKKISSNVYRDSFHEAFKYIRQTGGISIVTNDA
jgi:hypothetical protein